MTSPALILALSITFDRFMRAVTVDLLIVRKITHISRFTAGGMNGHTKSQVFQLFGSVYNGRKYFACYEVLFLPIVDEILSVLRKVNHQYS
jgi:hypothetical protein